MMSQALSDAHGTKNVRNTTNLTNVVEQNSGENSASKVGKIEQKNSSIGPKATISNEVKIKDSSNVATGKGAVTHLGTIDIADVQIMGKTKNQVEIKDSQNIASGEGSTAQMGTITINDSVIGKSGVVANRATISNAKNISSGTKNKASMGSVTIQSSKVDGRVENIARDTNSTNIAQGTENKTNLGVIDLTNTIIGEPATVTNTATTQKVINMGVGFANKTSTASVQAE